MEFINNFIDIFIEAAPWLVLGFVAAGIIKVLVPEGKLEKWLGGKGLWSVTKAALIGAPLPLCSCGVLPAATQLHRSGASKSSTISFLISTPETGVDSVSLSYVMLGPVMAVIRPIAAVGSAIITGLIAGFVPEKKASDSAIDSGCNDDSCGCSSTANTAIPVQVVQMAAPSIKTNVVTNTDTSDVIDNQAEGLSAQADGSSCNTGCCSTDSTPANDFISKMKKGMHYALVEMVDDLIVWLTIGLVLAALISTIFPPMAMAEWGSGLSAMILMLLIGVPMYICATASTPIAASLILAGVSPGTVLVFLLAGPATNIATIGVLNREMGKYIVMAYLAGISLCSILFGYLTDWYLTVNNIDVASQMTAASEWMPQWIAISSSIILLIAVANVLLKKAKLHILTMNKQRA